jgi:hypothetical protein
VTFRNSCAARIGVRAAAPRLFSIALATFGA